MCETYIFLSFLTKPYKKNPNHSKHNQNKHITNENKEKKHDFTESTQNKKNSDIIQKKTIKLNKNTSNSADRATSMFKHTNSKDFLQYAS